MTSRSKGKCITAATTEKDANLGKFGMEAHWVNHRKIGIDQLQKLSEVSPELIDKLLAGKLSSVQSLETGKFIIKRNFLTFEWPLEGGNFWNFHQCPSPGCRTFPIIHGIACPSHVGETIERIECAQLLDSPCESSDEEEFARDEIYASEFNDDPEANNSRVESSEDPFVQKVAEKITPLGNNLPLNVKDIPDCVDISSDTEEEKGKTINKDDMLKNESECIDAFVAQTAQEKPVLGPRKKLKIVKPKVKWSGVTDTD